MSKSIYIVDRQKDKPLRVCAASFEEIGVKERADLEKWVLLLPEILGESLLIITSEFDKFSNSSKRLDVLALDKKGALVVIELKLDITRSWADQQAIRYAAFCSTMTMQQAVDQFAKFHECTIEEAKTQIADFLGVSGLPTLNNQPRIILAAGSMDDPELIACVKWLREFNIDIRCVELTAYRDPDSGKLHLHPRIVVPACETAVRVLDVEGKRPPRARRKSDYSEFWAGVEQGLGQLDLPMKLELEWVPTNNYFKAYCGDTLAEDGVCYEYVYVKTRRELWIQISLQNADAAINILRMQRLQGTLSAATVEGNKILGETWMRGWTHVGLRVTVQESIPDAKDALRAARLMGELVRLTWPQVQRLQTA